MPTAKKKVSTRAKRSAQTRESETRNQPWKPPALLDTPPPPPGYKYRWLRESMLNDMDRGNMSKRIREGFRLVSPEELEDEGYELPVVDEGKHAGVIGVGGLLLAIIPEEIVNQREAYFADATSRQMEAIDNEMVKSSDPIMPIGAPQRKSTVSFGNPENKPTRGD